MCLIRGNYIVSVNVGDSRAILCTKEYFWKSTQLTKDHVPGNIDEQERLKGIKEPERKSVKQIQMRSTIALQQLVLTRSIGNFTSGAFGNTSKPDVIEH